MQIVFSCAPKQARKCESRHWFPFSADGRSVARSLYDHVITKYSWMGRLPHFLSCGAPLTRSASRRAWSYATKPDILVIMKNFEKGTFLWEA